MSALDTLRRRVRKLEDATGGDTPARCVVVMGDGEAPKMAPGDRLIRITLVAPPAREAWAGATRFEPVTPRNALHDAPAESVPVAAAASSSTVPAAGWCIT